LVVRISGVAAAVDEFADLRVVVLHDDPNILQIMKVVMRSLGVRDLACVESRDAAMEACAEDEPDVIIVDAVLDGKSAFDFVRGLRDRETSFNAYIPVIVASGHTQLSIVRGAINAGAHEFVSFPLSPENLAKRLYSAVFMGRPFITLDDYFGPDRRRFVDPHYRGDERRADAEQSRAQLEARAAAESKAAKQLAS